MGSHFGVFRGVDGGCISHVEYEGSDQQNSPRFMKGKSVGRCLSCLCLHSRMN